MTDRTFEVFSPTHIQKSAEIIIATDGGYQKGMHSSAYIVTDGTWGVQAANPIDDRCKPACVPATELQAIWLGLKNRAVDDDITILSDSMIACNTIRKWRQGNLALPKWYDVPAQAPLDGSPYTPVLLRSRVREAGSRLQVRHVKGHSGNLLNEAADGLCGIGINFLRRRYDRAEATKRCAELAGSFLLSYTQTLS